MRILLVAMVALLPSVHALGLPGAAGPDGIPPHASGPAFPQAAVEEPEPGAPVEVLSDPAGDLAYGPVGIPAPVQRTLDLLRLELLETEATVLFRLAVGGTNSLSEPAALDTGRVTVYFRHGQASYSLAIQQVSEVDTYYEAQLYRYAPSLDQYTWVAYNRPVVDAAARTVTAEFAKDDLPDAEGAAPFPGRLLEGFRAISTSWKLGGDVDRMPDDGEGKVPFAVRAGPGQSADAALWSPSPMRASNGEATTFVFDVRAENRGAPAAFVLEARSLPPGWEVRFPQGRLELAQGEQRAVPVLVTVPFAHEHGTSPTATVAMVAEGDPSRFGQVRLGVSYPAVPQPSGHHDTLAFHSYQTPNVARPVQQAARAGGSAWAWMSAEEPQEEGVPVPAYATGGGSLGSVYTWYVPLSPGLQVGLDFDLERPARLAVPVRAGLPLTDARMDAALYVSWRTSDGGWDSTRLASLPPTEPVSLGQGEQRLFELEGLPAVEADRVPFRVESYLVWSLRLTSSRPYAGTGAEAPDLMPGGSTTLPLVEYHDAVEQVFADLHGIALDARGPVRRDLGPGRTTLFNLTARNAGEEAELAVRLVGAHAPWAQLVGADRLSLQAGARAPFSVAVRPPADAAVGTELDLTVELVAGEEVRALLRLGGAVTAEGSVPDEAALALPGQREAPAALAAATLGLLAAAIARRGRAR
jgi:hypothetical protein